VSFDNKEKGKQPVFFSRGAEKCELGARPAAGVEISGDSPPPEREVIAARQDFSGVTFLAFGHWKIKRLDIKDL
jgi:hypothetical protein